MDVGGDGVVEVGVGRQLHLAVSRQLRLEQRPGLGKRLLQDVRHVKGVGRGQVSVD